MLVECRFEMINNRNGYSNKCYYSNSRTGIEFPVDK